MVSTEAEDVAQFMPGTVVHETDNRKLGAEPFALPQAA